MKRPDARVSVNWYTEAFDAVYPVVYSHRTVASAAPEAGFAARQTALRATDTLLDLCCGNGRHLAHLTPQVRQSTGLDYSADLLRLARSSVPVKTRLVRGDMRALPFPPTFDIVTNFFTSFGYFADDEENLGVIREISRVLKAGGRFFLDYLNPEHVRRHLTARTVRDEGPYNIVEERWIDATQHRVNKKTTVHMSGAPIACSEESVRLYDEGEMHAMFNRAGLEVDDVFGDYTGETPACDSARRIFLGHKP